MQIYFVGDFLDLGGVIEFKQAGCLPTHFYDLLVVIRCEKSTNL